LQGFGGAGKIFTNKNVRKAVDSACFVADCLLAEVESL
jgi:hypothetical protein